MAEAGGQSGAGASGKDTRYDYLAERVISTLKVADAAWQKLLGGDTKCVQYTMYEMPQFGQWAEHTVNAVLLHAGRPLRRSLRMPALVGFYCPWKERSLLR